jgi:Flp pilus assembly protein TadD
LARSSRFFVANQLIGPFHSSRPTNRDDRESGTKQFNRANRVFDSQAVSEGRRRETIVKPANITRRALLAALIASSSVVASTGCSSSGFSMASMNPFSKATPAIGEAGAKPGITDSFAAGAAGAGQKVLSVGTSAKGMFGKTTSAVTGVFQRDTPEADAVVDSTDPLRLDNKPDQVDPEVFVANGQLWESTGDMTKAMESYTRALETNPKHAPALTSLARLHFRQGNLPQAVLYFEKALVEKPQDAGLHNDLGLTLSKLGNQPAAIASLEKALQLAPGTSRYANNLASVKFESGDPNSALIVLMQNNKPAVAHFNMAYLHFKKGQMPQAQSHLGEAMKFEPQAGSDPATGRAIERSREMLAQIQGAQPRANPNYPSTMGAIAKTLPQTTTAGGAMTSTPGYAGPVQQTSQSGTDTAGVARAASMGPAMAAIGLPSQPATQRIATSTATQSTSVTAGGPTAAVAAEAKTASTATTSKWDSWNRAVSGTDDAAQSAPIRPADPATTATPSTIESATPSNSFTLPDGFTLPSE